MKALQKTSLTKAVFNTKVDMIMPDDFLEKIKYLCTEIHEVEWSGILLYSVEGSIRDAKNMKIHLKDIIPMDRGTSGYTEYKFNEKKRDKSGYEDRHIDYVSAHPEALQYKIGLIHSHNNMAVFFSGTDMEELEENSFSHNFYVSLIVNNKLDLMAKIGIKATCDSSNIVETYKALDEKGQEYVINEQTVSKSIDKLFIYDCNIISNVDSVKVPEEFVNMVKEINKPKTNAYTIPSYTNKEIGVGTGVSAYPKYPSYTNKNAIKSESRTQYNYYGDPITKVDNNALDIEINALKILGKMLSYKDEEIEKFLNIDDIIEDYLDVAEQFQITDIELEAELTRAGYSYNKTFIQVIGSIYENSDMYNGVTDELLSSFNYYMKYYPQLKGIKETIEKVRTKVYSKKIK